MWDKLIENGIYLGIWIISGIVCVIIAYGSRKIKYTYFTFSTYLLGMIWEVLIMNQLIRMDLAFVISMVYLIIITPRINSR